MPPIAVHRILSALADVGLFYLFNICFALVNIIHGLISWRLTGARPAAISILRGHPALKFQALGCNVTLGWLPIGGGVDLDRTELDAAPPSRRAMSILAGVVLNISVIAAFAGPAAAPREFAAAYRQVSGGAIHPFSYGRVLLGKLFAVAHESFIRGFGILAAKSFAINIWVPIRHLLALSPTGRRRGWADRDRRNRIDPYLVAVYFSLVAGWALAFATYAWHGA